MEYFIGQITLLKKIMEFWGKTLWSKKVLFGSFCFWIFLTLFNWKKIKQFCKKYLQIDVAKNYWKSWRHLKKCNPFKHSDFILLGIFLQSFSTKNKVKFLEIFGKQRTEDASGFHNDLNPFCSLISITWSFEPLDKAHFWGFWLKRIAGLFYSCSLVYFFLLNSDHFDPFVSLTCLSKFL